LEIGALCEVPGLAKRISRSYPILGDDSDIALTSRKKTLKIPSAMTDKIRRELIERHGLSLSAVAQEECASSNVRVEADPPPAVLMPEILGRPLHSSSDHAGSLTPASVPLVGHKGDNMVATKVTIDMPQVSGSIEPDSVASDPLLDIQHKLGVSGSVLEVFGSAKNPYSDSLISDHSDNLERARRSSGISAVVRSALGGVIAGLVCGLVFVTHPVTVPKIATKNEPRIVAVQSTSRVSAADALDRLHESIDEHLITLVNKVLHRIQIYELMISQMDQRIASMEAQLRDRQVERVEPRRPAPNKKPVLKNKTVRKKKVVARKNKR
jgi:hypothetical protein